MSRIGLGIVVAVALLFVAGVLTLAAVAANQSHQELITRPGPPPGVPARPDGGTSGRASAYDVRPLGGWVRQIADRTGVPSRALYAYAHTDLALHVDAPACKLSWATLAGIGRVESSHGYFGGTRLDAKGRPITPIFGSALDGSPGLQKITDTDQGALDGDPRYDRAVGPMQFIPASWMTWGTDADGDGRADPQDIDDAALAAGRYLCSQDRDLSTGEGWWNAVLSYNNSVSYAQLVLNAANGYAQLSLTAS